MATFSLIREIGGKVAERRKWYSPHMAAASRAIAERIPLVDIVLDVRDARIPISSEYKPLIKCKSSAKWIVVLNKIDLANPCKTKEWMSYFEQNNCVCFGVNSHNKENIKQFLNFLLSQVRQLGKNSHYSTTTALLVGIPNVGKSALANSLHKIGRISAAEKGKLKNATVSPHPGETKDISSFKIGSHPNVYVLDTPGVLPPQISNVEVCSKLTLTGAINDNLVGEQELAQYFLTILNLSGEYKKWSKLCHNEGERPLVECLAGPEMDVKRRRQYSTDHTQDFIVNAVRQTLCETVSSFDGNKDNENDLLQLAEAEIIALEKAFQIPVDSKDDARLKVCAKLLNLFRTGRLGHYTLDSIP